MSRALTADAKKKYFRERVRYWAGYFGVNRKIHISVSFPDSSCDPTDVAEVDIDHMQYNRATISALPGLLSIDKGYTRTADASACHEVLHLVAYDLMSYCENMFHGDDGKKAELEKLEEKMITTIQVALAGKIGGK